MNFEQNNINIELNGKVVFTVKQLEAYVQQSGVLLTGETEEVCINEHPFEKEYKAIDVDVEIPVSEYLDSEDNFQSACEEFYNLNNK